MQVKKMFKKQAKISAELQRKEHDAFLLREQEKVKKEKKIKML